MYKGLIHFHSHHSFDSILSIKKIVSFAQKENINFLILTDHDTIKGSLELEKYISDRNIDIKVIIAAEYFTEYGDIIAINIKSEITEMKFDLFVEQVKKQNGLLFFPHPYHGHSHIDYIAQRVDYIEIFNSRVDKERNERAEFLARKFNKRIYYATDAHNYNSLKNSIIEIKSSGDLMKSLKNNEVHQLNGIKSRQYEVISSQFIKSFKCRDRALLISLTKRVIMHILRFSLFKKI